MKSTALYTLQDKLDLFVKKYKQLQASEAQLQQKVASLAQKVETLEQRNADLEEALLEILINFTPICSNICCLQT
jgi:uncharacterized protein YlxW (UPF0749 family)